MPRRLPARRVPQSCLGRQLDVAAIGKFQITQMDTAFPALDHEPRSNREPVWQACSSRTHGTLLGMCAPVRRGMPDNGDRSATPRQNTPKIVH
jgi:hypothetical protein